MSQARRLSGALVTFVILFLGTALVAIIAVCAVLWLMDFALGSPDPGPMLPFGLSLDWLLR